MKRLWIGLILVGCLGKLALAAAPVRLPFDTYSGYFVSNKFEPDAAASFLVVTDQGQFDSVFGAAMVMGDKSHRLPKDVFRANVVLAAIKRGKAFWEFKVEAVTDTNGVVELCYTTTEKESQSATFACPVIVSIPKGKYVAVRFIENGSAIKTVAMGGTSVGAQGAPYLGVALGDSSDERVKGATIFRVTPGSPAAKSGLVEGDIILAVNKSETPTAEKLVETIQLLKAGEKVTLKVWREGKEKAISVTLGRRPAEPGEETAQKGRLVLGLAFHHPDESGKLIVAKVFPGTPAEDGGIKPDDVLLELDNVKIKDYEQLRAELRKKKAGDKIVLRIERDGKTIEKSLKLKAALERN